MKILANAKITKLKEYSQSYGGPETIEVSYLKVYNKEIYFVSSAGSVGRMIRIGTKLLISFTGTEISERTFNLRTKKADKANKERIALLEAERNAEILKNKEIAAVQLEAWKLFLTENPQKIVKYLDKVNSLPSSKWRNLLRMKAAKHVCDGQFNSLVASAPELVDVLRSF